MRIKIKAILLLFIIISSVQAKINIASVLADNMVLQRNTEVKIWGTSLPNEKLINSILI